jgi:uncharacterized protein
MGLAITFPNADVSALCRRHHIRKLAVFGSALRDDFGPDSDIDLLVEFEPGHTPGWEIVSIEDELSDLMGRTVDLRTPQELSRHWRQRAIDSALVIHE